MLGDGATVRIDATTAFEPDALVYCGPRLLRDDVVVPAPVIVVEVLSPSTRNFDAGGKLTGYFAVPSVRHYLMIDPDRDVVVHNRREGDGIGASAHGRGTVIRLDPPGLDVAVDDVLGRG